METLPFCHACPHKSHRTFQDPNPSPNNPARADREGATLTDKRVRLSGMVIVYSIDGFPCLSLAHIVPRRRRITPWASRRNSESTNSEQGLGFREWWVRPLAPDRSTLTETSDYD